MPTSISRLLPLISSVSAAPPPTPTPPTVLNPFTTHSAALYNGVNDYYDITVNVGSAAAGRMLYAAIVTQRIASIISVALDPAGLNTAGTSSFSVQPGGDLYGYGFISVAVPSGASGSYTLRMVVAGGFTICTFHGATFAGVETSTLVTAGSYDDGSFPFNAPINLGNPVTTGYAVMFMVQGSNLGSGDAFLGVPDSNYNYAEAENAGDAVAWFTGRIDNTVGGNFSNVRLGNGGGDSNVVFSMSGFRVAGPTPSSGATVQVVATETGGDTASLNVTASTQAQVAATETGSDTASLAVTVSTSAQIVATETGSDTASLLVSMPLTATVNAAESGSDTAALNVTVSTQAQVSATESGQDTSSLAITVSTQAQVQAVETGSDIASLVVTVGEVGLTARVEATESGADTASLIATVSVHAQVQAIEVGSDTAALAVSVGNPARVAATETGSDTASLSVTTSTQAQVQAVESGQDTAALVVAVSTSVQISATEVGSDVALLRVTVGGGPDPDVTIPGAVRGRRVAGGQLTVERISGVVTPPRIVIGGRVMLDQIPAHLRGPNSKSGVVK